MALAANTATVQILDDNASHVVAKFQFFQHTANTGSHESSALKINVNTLACRTMDVTLSAVPTNLWPGDKAIQTTNTAIQGTVASWKANVVTLVLSNTTALFQNSNTIVFNRPGGNSDAYTITATGASLTSAKLALRQAAWSVAGNTATRVALEWAGTPNAEIVQFGTGSGYIGKNALATAIPCDANAATGDVLISTYSTPALSGYTIIAEFAKVTGFAPQGV